MNILVLNWQDIKNPLGGGAEVHLHEIFKRVVGLGHSVTLYCSKFPGATETEEIDGLRVIREGGRSLFNFHVPRRYQSQFRKEGFDVVVDDINKIPFYTPWFVDKPLAGIVHHLFGKAIFLEAPLIPASYVYLAEKVATKVYRNTPMAVVSESTRQELIGLGFPAGNIVIVPNAVNTKVYAPSADLAQGRPLIGHVGRLKKYKSVDHLLRAFEIVLKDIPDARLRIVGDGDFRPDLEKLAHELPIADRVEFTGYLSQAEKVRHLNQMSVAVNCSVKEGWGLTVIEANACGVPVVASDVPGLRDSVVDEKTGLLYEFGNIEQLAQKITLVLRDENLRNKMRVDALEWGRSFNWEESAKKMIDFLERVIARKTPRSVS
ncbi:MAG: glycosyltransferase family 4 protein [Ignavibacteriales bacterium]|nr:glycosyltransferase family 4 protein [Ignavibacteriales bacterium]